jgi:tetratricopeptide (TPR) repeat protein
VKRSVPSTLRTLVGAAALVAAIAAIWWFARPETHDSIVAPEPRALRHLVLPDLARLDTAVQQQIRDEHARLLMVLDAPRATTSERAEASGSLGKLLLAAEFFVEGERAFLDAQALAPADMRWPYLLGHVYRARQDLPRAIAMFERALALARDDVPSLIWLGDLLLASGDAAAAETPLRRALVLDPRSAAAASRLGRAALERRDYARAIEYLQQTLALNPSATSVHYPLGMAYRALGRAAEAEAHLTRATDLGSVPPSDPLMEAVAGMLRGAGAFESRGMAALEARDWKGAVDNLQQAVALGPANAVTRLNLGTALSLAGDAEAARRELREAVRLDPRLAKAHFGLGVLAQDAGQWAESVERFTTAIDRDAGFVDAHFTLAEALRRTGRAADALGHYRHVLALDPAASQARFGQAMALVRLRRYAEARQVLVDAVRVHPEQPGFPHALARILAAAPDTAVRDGQRALGLMQPLVTAEESPAVAETMGMVMAEMGRFEEAVQWQERAIASATAAGQQVLAVQMQESLTAYRRRQPCRTPWREDDPVIAIVADSMTP